MRNVPLLTAGLLLASGSLSLAAPQKKPAQNASKAAAKAPATKPFLMGTIRGVVPGRWVSQEPGSEFRLAQYQVPTASGDQAASLFIVFHFGGGQGGGVEDNMRRWIGMLRQPDGSDSAAVAKRSVQSRGGLKISALDVSGTYMERPFPASPQATPRPGYRMLAAVVEIAGENPEGPYFLRLVGPAKTVEAARPGWEALLASLKLP